MKIFSMIILLFCFSLQAQQKRWQLDSIQQIQFYSDKIEYVYKTFHQSYDPKKRIVTKINDIKDSYGDDYMYICKYNKQDSLISETQYIYNKSKKDWKEIEKIVYEYSSNEIKKKIYTLDEEEWKISRIFHLEKINGKLYLKKDEYKSNSVEKWDVNTYEPYREWYYYSVKGTIYKEKVPTEERYNRKGQIIEKIYENNFISKKERFTYNNSGDIKTLELYDGKDELGEFKKWEKRVYTYAPDILNKEVVDKWQENDKNKTPHNAILLKEVYRPTDDEGYELVYKQQYYYSPIP